MKVLFTLLPGTGSLRPLLPLAHELFAAGHEAVFCSAASFRPDVEAAGFPCVDAGLDYLLSEPGYLEPLAEAAGGVTLPPPTGVDRMAWVTTKLFIAGAARRMLPGLVELARDWGADAIVRESLEFAGCVAAEALGLIHVSVAAAADSALDHRALLTGPLAVLRQDVGLPPDLSGDMPYRHLHLCACPPTFHGPGARFPATARFVRHTDRNDGALPAWADTDRPIVLVSLGTVFHRTHGVYEAVLEALADEPLEVAIALGPGQDPARLGQVPPNVHVHEHLPTAALLDRCVLLVTHGGFNSVKEAMSRAVPMVVIPIASDQHYSAERLATLGLAQFVAPDRRTPEQIRTAARTVLADPSYQARAHDMAVEMAALPPMSAAACRLANLIAARSRRQADADRPSTMVRRVTLTT